MKNAYLIIMLLAGFLFNISKGQNLIPNSSFELYDTCPDYDNQVARCLGWENWLTTPDYFNVCAPCCAVSVPYNLSNINPNFQIPHTGNAYMGYFNHWSRQYIYTWPWIRDLFGCQLAQPMQIGATYNFSMYVSLTKWGGSNSAPCATNKIGVKFTTQSYSNYANQYTSPLVDNSASIYFDTLITDTANWVLLSGTFTADSVYQYMGIGNYFDDFHTDSLIVGSFNLCFSYYFVDDVSLTLTTGLDDLVTNQLNIYPNPLKDATVVELLLNKTESVIKLYNCLGIDVTQKFKVSLIDKGYKIERNQMASGIYLISIFQNGNNYSKKLIIY